jgi:hypothetical protein
MIRIKLKNVPRVTKLVGALFRHTIGEATGGSRINNVKLYIFWNF